MATSDRIIEAANRQASGEELSGADRQFAEMVNNPALPDLPESVQSRWANMPLEGRAQALGALVDERQGGSTAPVESAPQGNTGPSTAPMKSIRNKEERDAFAEEGWDIPDSNLQDTWMIPEMPKADGAITKPTKNDNLSWAAIINAANSGSTYAQELLRLHEQGAQSQSKETLAEASGAYQDEEANISREYLQNQMTGEVEDPEELVDTAEAVRKDISRADKKRGQLFRTTIEALGVEESEEQIIDTYVGDLALYNVVQEAADEVGLGDQVWGLARAFVFGSLKDNISLSGISGVAGSEDYFKKQKTHLDSLPPEEREAALRVIDKELRELVPDTTRVAALSVLASPSASADAADQFGALDPLMDAAELAVILSGIGAAAYGTYKGVKALKKVGGRADDAGDAIATAVAARDSRAVEAIGMDNDSAASTLDPFKGEWIDRQSLDDVSMETRTRVLEFERQAQATGMDIAAERRFIREGWLTKEEEAVARRNIEAKLSSGQGVDNVVTRREGDKIIASFDVKEQEEVFLRDAADEVVRDANGNPVSEMRTRTVQQQQEFELRLNEDTQEIELADPGMIKRHLTAKGVWATDDFRSVVRSAERLDLAESAVLEDFRELWKAALEPVLGKGFTGFVKTFTPKQRKKVQQLDSILISGDEYVDELGNKGKVYTAKELKSGILGFVPDEDVIEAYYNARNVIDGLFYARNAEMRKELSLKGMKNWNVDGGNQQHIAKALSDANAAANSTNRARPRYVYNDETGELLPFETLNIKDTYDQGKVMVKLDKPAALAGDNTEVVYAITNADNVGELPLEVLNYRKGYVPKINENVGHIVKLAKRRNIDGTDYAVGTRQAAAGARAVRFFDSKKEADIWVDQQNKLLADQGVSLQDQAYLRVADRQLEKERSVTAMSSDGGSPFSGGLYTGSRSQEEILYGPGEGTKPTRVNAFESISRAMTATSRYVARNEWRLGLEQRILKTANQLFAGEHSPLDEAFTSFDQLRAVKTDTEAGRKVRAMYDAAADWLNFPTSEELLFKESIQGILDNAGVLTKMPGSKKALHSLKSKDPVGAARSAAFHGLLGFWNPVQLWVQAQGAAVALSMNVLRPDRMAKVMKDQFLIHSLQYGSKTDKAIKLRAKAFGMKEEDVREMIEAWDKTGLQQSVLTTADHSAAEAGYGVTMGALRNSVDKGLFFYRGGELFNRRLSFTTAFDEWKRANKGKKVTDDDLKDILDRSNNMMLNMGKAQRATWQRGILGVATQFQQINFRIMETLLGANGNFNKRERGKIMLGQVGLYGAAGVPLSSMGATWLMEMFGYKDQAALENEVGPEVVKAVNEGFLGWATLQILGADVEIGDRSSLLGGIRRTAEDFIFTEGTFADKLFGAFGNTSSRFWSTMTGSYKPLSLGLAEGRVIDPVKSVVSPVLASISTFRNADKAIFMHNMHRIIGTNKNNLIIKDFSWQEELSTAIGFRLNQEANIWKLDARNRAIRDYEKNMSNVIVGMFNEYALKSIAGQVTPEYTEQFENDLAMIYQAIDPDGFGQARVMKLVQSKLKDTKSKEFEVWEEFMDLTNGRLMHEMIDGDKMLRAPGAALRGAIAGGDVMLRGTGTASQESEEE